MKEMHPCSAIPTPTLEPTEMPSLVWGCGSVEVVLPSSHVLSVKLYLSAGPCPSSSLGNPCERMILFLIQEFLHSVLLREQLKEADHVLFPLVITDVSLA
jgi:hypothetical protein